MTKTLHNERKNVKLCDLLKIILRQKLTFPINDRFIKLEVF